jgi:hypothetical protein
MAKPRFLIPELEGETGLRLVLEIVRDAPLLQQHLDAIDHARAEAKKYVDLVGPAEEIQTLRARAQIEAAEAARKLREADKRIGEMDAAAEQELFDARHKFDTDADARVGGMDRREAAIVERERAVTERERLAAASEAASKALAEAAGSRMAEADRLKADYTGHLARLRAAGVNVG